LAGVEVLVPFGGVHGRFSSAEAEEGLVSSVGLFSVAEEDEGVVVSPYVVVTSVASSGTVQEQSRLTAGRRKQNGRGNFMETKE